MTQPTRMATPAIKKLFVSTEEEFVKERMAHDEANLGEDWQNSEPNECNVCHGTGQASPEFPDDPHCLGCDGTGIHFILTYGVEDGKPFAYTDEYGVDNMKKMCADYREAYRASQLAGKTPDMIRPYILPKTLEMELQARGYLPHEIYSGKYVKEIANIVAREYPAFMCVPYKNF